jgi:hypothetical protein
VLVCRDHPKGSKLDYIHPLLSPNGMLPGKWSDQNAHAIVVLRTISPNESKVIFNNISNAWNALFISWTWHNELNWLWKVWFPFQHIRMRWAVILLWKILH